VKIGQIEEKTEKCEATLNPKWNFSMEFEVRSMREKDVSTLENFSLLSMLKILSENFMVETDRELK